MARGNQREDAVKELQKTSACHAEISRLVAELWAGSPEAQESSLSAHAGVLTQLQIKGPRG